MILIKRILTIFLTLLLSLFPLHNSAHASELNRTHFDLANITEWHEVGYTGAGVTIVVNDTGNVRKQDGAIIATDYDTDGTHGASVINIIRQIAPNAEIHYVNYYAKNNRDAVNYAIAKDAQLMNYSMYAPYSQANAKLAYDENVFIVTSAGNTHGIVDDYEYNPYVNAIGALLVDTMEIASYSSYGDGLDFVAPTDSLVCMSEDCVDTAYFSGTSAASPFFTGLMALYYEYFADQYGRFPTVAEARKYAESNTLDLNTEGYDIKTGHGLFILPDLPRALPQLSNPLAVAMRNPAGEIRYIHRDYVDEYVRDLGYGVIHK